MEHLKKGISPQETEKESKSMLSSFAYENLMLFFGNPQIVEQTNYYFDDSKSTIRKKLPKGATLRVRDKKGKFELQFKLPSQDGTPEHQDSFTNQMLFDMSQSKVVPPGNVRQALIENGVDVDSIESLGSMVTKRATLKEDALKVLGHEFENLNELCLDETVYSNGNADFEIEVDSKISMEHSHQILLSVLKKNEILEKPSENKITRFYRSVGLI